MRLRFIAVLLLLAAAPLTYAQIPEPIRDTPYDYRCVDESGGVVSNHQRADKAQYACQVASADNPGTTYYMEPGRYRFLVEAEGDPDPDPDPDPPVEPEPDPQVALSVTPQTIELGQQVTVEWSSTADTCVISALGQSETVDGTGIVTTALTETAVITLECAGETVTATVEVVDEPEPEPEPDPDPPVDPNGAVIRGSGFGPGPDVVVYDDFEGGAPAQGSWASSNRRIVNGAHDAYDGDRQRMLQARFNRSRSVYVSYRVSVPGTFPGNDGGARRFSSDSSWKLAWLMDSPDGHRFNDGRYDLCLPSHTGGGRIRITGNSIQPDRDSVGNDWWDWDGWMRISVWIRNPMTDTPGGEFEVITSRGRETHSFDAPTDRIPISSHAFDTLNVPGWIRRSGGNDIRVHYDDVYVAAGQHAASRVEVSNSSDHDDDARIAVVESWSDDEIRIAPIDARFAFVFVDNELITVAEL